MNPDRYRPDIDGLRSIAVLSVLFFHFDLAAMTGGFIGVDVFFVISGFLITRLIVDELERDGSFRFGRFYTRRIRRLFPAMLTTYTLSLVAAFLLFSPEEMQRASSSIVYALASISNILFWQEADYFDVAASVKPLLHTWSLSVEEQFYLFWPATLFLIVTKAPRRLLAPLLGLLAVASLAAAEVMLRHDPAGAFYLLPSRIFEFLMGAAVVWLGRHRPARDGVEDVLLALGLVLIVVPAFLYSKATNFPGLAAALPCAGAALTIYAGRAPRLGLILSNPVTVAIGRWSYSIYLVHWPLFVFWSAYTFADVSLAEKLALTALSILLGWLQYRLVEERHRHVRKDSWSAPWFVTAAAALAVLLAVPAWKIKAAHGLAWRIPEERRILTSRKARQTEIKSYCKRIDATKPADLFTCQNDRHKSRDIIVWGDSHAMHLIAGLSEAYPEYNVYIVYLSGCPPQSGFGGFVRDLGKGQEANQACIERNKKALTWLLSYRPSVVVLSNAKRGKPVEIAGVTEAIIAQLRAGGHNAFVLGDFIRPARSLINCVSVPDWLISEEQIRSRCVGDPEAIRQELEYNADLSPLLSFYVAPEPAQCPDGKCQYFDRGTVLFRDDHHLSTTGSTLFIERLKDKLPIPP